MSQLGKSPFFQLSKKKKQSAGGVHRKYVEEFLKMISRSYVPMLKETRIGIRLHNEFKECLKWHGTRRDANEKVKDPNAPVIGLILQRSMLLSFDFMATYLIFGSYLITSINAKERQTMERQMGCSSSRIEKNEALRLCKERRRFIKQAIDSRYALAAAHLSYVQSLRNIGIALRRFAEAGVLIESSLSTSATELDKTPSHSSYLSPSPSHNAEIMDSPLHYESPLSPPISTLSYMRLGGSSAVTVRMNPSSNSFMDDESLTFPPPPPPPPPEIDSSWDFFDPTDQTESFRFIGDNGFDMNFDNAVALRQFRGEEVVSFMEDAGENVGLKGKGEVVAGSVRPEWEQRACEISSFSAIQNRDGGDSINGITLERYRDAKRASDKEVNLLKSDEISSGSAETLAGNAALGQCSSKREKTAPGKDLCAEREDPSEFITHRAKDFLSSIKDIEHRFFRASESGQEVSRMLEANKIRLSCSESKGRSPVSVFLAAFHLVCCQGETVLIPHEPPQRVTKVITWNRSTSSQSSSSKNPLATASKDDVDDSGSDFVEEFCMIAGSHSSTLDRLYAWERKLYDEVKVLDSGCSNNIKHLPDPIYCFML
ncbi:hypothetical protein HHK36_009451 [Tetracentron sinense]|uniref:Uncharacterized protein n=1 Tax=Tetracentron sinense TaxID=13715 RepID=A0A834ZBQ1_TETSI|nr:hypothetical protein HHK36_009451 [Tetracentron sinense]